MIFDTLQNASSYFGMGPRYEKALRYLQNFDPATPDGKVVVDGDDVYAVVQSYVPTPAAERPFEAHRKYADIQFIASGEEIIQYAHLPTLKETTPYAAGGDYAIYSGSDEFPLAMSRGFFAILLPQDGHKPGCRWRSDERVKKVVMKVRV